MAGATSLTPPSPGLSATLSPGLNVTLLPNKSVESNSHKGPENVKLTTLYRCTERKHIIIYKQNMAFSNVLCEELKPVPPIQRRD